MEDRPVTEQSGRLKVAVPSARELLERRELPTLAELNGHRQCPQTGTPRMGIAPASTHHIEQQTTSRHVARHRWPPHRLDFLEGVRRMYETRLWVCGVARRATSERQFVIPKIDMLQARRCCNGVDAPSHRGHLLIVHTIPERCRQPAKKCPRFSNHVLHFVFTERHSLEFLGPG